MVLALATAPACHDFEGLLDECVRQGRCGDAGSSAGGAGGGGGTAGGAAQPAAVLSVSPPAVSFSATPGSDSAEQTLTISNAPDAGPAGDVQVAYVGLSPSAFVASDGCSGTLAPGAQCTFGMTFSPAASALPADAGGSFTFSAANANTVSVAVQTEVTPALQLSPDPLEFGSVTVGKTRAADLTLRNLKPLTTETVSLVVQPPFFVSGTPCPGGVSSTAPCVIGFEFRPSDAGVFAQDVLVTLMNGGAATVRMTGNGVAAGSLSLTPDPIAAGDVDAGTTHAVPFTLSSAALVGVGPISFALEGDAGVFAVDAGACGFLDAGQSCMGVVYFSPTTWGAVSARLVADGGPAGFAIASIDGAGRQGVSLDLQVSPAGAGTVLITDGGLACTTACSRTYEISRPPFPTVELAASRTRLYARDGWQGCAPTADGGCVVVMMGPQSVTATFTRVPVAFVTSSRYRGDLGGVNADVICTAHANDAGWSGTFRAWIETDGGSADRRIRDAGYARTDGLTFTQSKRQLYAGEVMHPLVLDERGRRIDGGTVWTSTTVMGTHMGIINTCLGWTEGTGTRAGMVGEPTAGTRRWTDLGPNQCDVPNRLYCFDQTATGALEAPAPPPPGAVLMFISQPRATNLPNSIAWPGFCAEDAADAGFPGAYVPYFSTTASSAAARVDAGLTGPVFRLDGVRLLDDAAALRAETPLLAPVNVTSRRAYVQGPIATGATTPGSVAASGDSCSSWQANTGTYLFGDSALSQRVDWFWLGGGENCLSPISVYCVGR